MNKYQEEVGGKMAKARRRKVQRTKVQNTGESEYRCLRCKKTLVKTNFPATNVVVQVPGFASYKRANAYVCPKCGFVELYVE